MELEFYEDAVGDCVVCGEDATGSRYWLGMTAAQWAVVRAYVEEITPETIDIIEEVIMERVPPGIFIIWETGPIELDEQGVESIESRAESFVKVLNLSDVGYEITLESENLSEALIYFRVRGGRIPFMTISRVMETENRGFEQWTWHKASSPSRSVEIVDFRIKEGQGDHPRILGIISPLVRNLGNGTAHVAKVETVVSNSTHTFSRSYITVSSKDPRNSLIGSGESWWMRESFRGLFLMQDGSGNWVRLVYDSLVEQTYTITITVYDGAGNALAERSFVHTFQ